MNDALHVSSLVQAPLYTQYSKATMHTPQPHRKASLTPRQKLLLHLIDRRVGATVVQITHALTPFYPAARPVSQLAVRAEIKTLLTAGLVALAHGGKPRTYVRTQVSYRLLPASWKPPVTISAPRNIETALA